MMEAGRGISKIWRHRQFEESNRGVTLLFPDWTLQVNDSAATNGDNSAHTNQRSNARIAPPASIGASTSLVIIDPNIDLLSGEDFSKPTTASTLALVPVTDVVDSSASSGAGQNSLVLSDVFSQNGKEPTSAIDSNTVHPASQTYPAAPQLQLQPQQATYYSNGSLPNSGAPQYEQAAYIQGTQLNQANPSWNGQSAHGLISQQQAPYNMNDQSGALPLPPWEAHPVQNHQLVVPQHLQSGQLGGGMHPQPIQSSHLGGMHPGLIHNNRQMGTLSPPMQSNQVGGFYSQPVHGGQFVAIQQQPMQGVQLMGYGYGLQQEAQYQSTNFTNSFSSSNLLPVLGLCAPNANQVNSTSRNFRSPLNLPTLNHEQRRTSSRLPEFPLPPAASTGPLKDSDVEGREKTADTSLLPDTSGEAVAHRLKNVIPDSYFPFCPPPLASSGKGTHDLLDGSGSSFASFQEKLGLPSLILDDKPLKFSYPSRTLMKSHADLLPSLSLGTNMDYVNGSFQDLPNIPSVPNFRQHMSDNLKQKQQMPELPPMLGLGPMQAAHSSLPENHKKVLDNIMMRTQSAMSKFFKKRLKVDAWSEDEFCAQKNLYFPSISEKSPNLLPDSRSNVQPVESNMGMPLSAQKKPVSVSPPNNDNAVISSNTNKLPHWLREAVSIPPSRPPEPDLPPTVSEIAQSVRLLYGEERPTIPPFTIPGRPPFQPKDPRKSLKKKRKLQRLQQLTPDIAYSAKNLDHSASVTSPPEPPLMACAHSLPWTDLNESIPALNLNLNSPSSSSFFRQGKKQTMSLSPSPEVLQLVASCEAPGPCTSPANDMPGENSSLRSSFLEEGESDEDIKSDQALKVPVPPAIQSQQATPGKSKPGSPRRSKRLQNKPAWVN